MTISIGIDDIQVAVPRTYVDSAELAKARGEKPEKYTTGIGIRRFAFSDSYEDANTLAANAAAQLLERNGMKLSDIGFLYVGTESQLDKSKPNATYVLGMLGRSGFGKNQHITADDTVFACLGATNVILRSYAEILSGIYGGKPGLVIASDVAKYDMLSSGEPTQGAGAVAMLMTKHPRLLELRVPPVGISTKDDHDFFKPHHKKYPVFEGHYSNECYKNSVRNALHHWSLQKNNGLEDPTDELELIVPHIPYPKMAQYTMANLWRDQRRNSTRWIEIESQIGPHPIQDGKSSKDFARELAEYEACFRKTQQFQQEFGRRVEPSLRMSAETGNLYTGSMYLGVESVLETLGNIDGKSMGLVAYGSSSGSKAFQVFPANKHSEVVKHFDLAHRLAERKKIDIPNYERLHREEVPINEPLFAPHPGDFFLEKIENEAHNEGHRWYGRA